MLPLFLLLCSASTLTAHIQSTPTPIIRYLPHLDIAGRDSGLEGIDCIYVINLDKRPRKWLRMRVLLRVMGLKGHRVPAVNGWDLSEEARRELAGPYPVRMRGGEIGCVLSHVAIWQHALEQGYKAIWVLEDDIEFHTGMQELTKLLTALQQIDPEWDILYTDINSRFGHAFVIAEGSDVRPDHSTHTISPAREDLGEGLVRLQQRYGTYSYLLSEQGIRKLFSYFTHVYLWTPIDNDMHYVPFLREYAPTYDIVSHWPNVHISDARMVRGICSP